MRGMVLVPVVRTAFSDQQQYIAEAVNKWQVWEE
jgi:hypothetical protein